MNSAQFDTEAAVVGTQIPKGFRVAILGSSTFWHENSARICTHIGELLANLSGLVLITGGVPGAGETVGRAFARGCRNLGRVAKIIHVLPRGSARCDYGATLFAGDDMGERREILGRLAELYVVVEGGPGTEHEARVAAANGSVLVPVRGSGGHAGALFPRLVRPPLAEEHTWRTLSDCEATPPKIAASVLEIVDAYARHAV
jgi:uncharacterized protein (TIGR00725 family)